MRRETDNGWQGDQGVWERGSEGYRGEWKLKFAQLSKANWGVGGGVWEVLRASIHSPSGCVNRDGRATGRECGPEWVGLLAAPVCQRCTVLAQGGHCRTLTSSSVTSSTPTPARPRANTSPK